MKTTPLLFNSDMVRALLDGRKTQTRRIIKGKRHRDTERFQNFYFDQWDELRYDGLRLTTIKCPYGKKGDLIWVRETFFIDTADYIATESDLENTYYRADGECCDLIPECACSEVGKPKWKPSIYMPRWASRLTLKITDVRVERVQDITSDDVLNEGVGHPVGTSLAHGTVTEQWNIQREFIPLWNSIHFIGSWDDNPFVWVIEFEVIKQNIDDYIEANQPNRESE